MWSPTSFPNERRWWCTAVFLAACAREAPPPTDSATPATVTESAIAGSDTSCRKSGAWQTCSVLDRLEHAGLVITARPDPARLPMFSIEGRTYETTRSTIHVFLYPDEAARRRDTDRLDPVAVAHRGQSYSWPDPATLVTSNNLAAVIISPNERQAERIALALGAGLPAK